MSAESKQQNEQLEKAKADNDQPSSSSIELIIKKPHSIWEYRPPLTVDKQLKPALKPYRSFNRGNQFSSLASASASAQPFQSADVTACQHQKSSMDSSQKLHVTLRSERNFSVKENKVEAVKPLEKRTEKTILPQATKATNQSVQSSFTGKQVEEGEKEEEMQSFIAPKVADHESLPSRPPSYRFSNFFSFFPQPSKEWHQQSFSTAAVYNSLSQQPPPNSLSSNSSSSPPPSPPPPYVITTTSFTQTPISSSSTSSPLKPAARSTSRLHHFIKYLLSGSNFYQKKKKNKVEKKKTGKKLPKTVVPSLEEDYQVTDRLEKVMKRVTLAATLLIFCAVLVLIARRCIASNADDADNKRNLFQQQIVAPSSGRLDLSQFDHLRGQVKVNRPRPSAERLQEAASRRKSSSSSSDQSRRDLLIAGLDGRVLANGGGGGERESSNTNTNSNSGLEKENSGSEFVVVSNSGGNRGRFHSPPRARPFNPPPPPPPRKPFIPFEKPLNRPQLGDNCSSCVQAKYLAHYYLKQCTAVVSRECRNTCTKYFRCPQQKEGSKTTAKPVIKFGEDVNQQQASLGCQYGGVKYAFGAQIPLLSEPCRFCRCRKRRFYNGTDSSSSSSSSIIGEIDCSPYIECPEMVFGVRASPGCHFTYRHDECCGKQLCPDELPVDDIKVKTVCRYRGKEYKYGEKIYPEEDTCKKCICDEQWNNHDPVGSKSCVQVRCTGYLKEEITKKCTPIYRADGCCPIDYICPPQKKLYDAKDDQLDQTTVGDEIPQSCTLRGKSYSFGRQLYIDRTDTHHGRVCAKCTCQVPPLFTCMADFRCSGQ